MTVPKIDVDAKLEYFIELPFNLSLPTGLYSLNIPNQVQIRRDMYYLQKGNELENPSTMLKQYLNQDQLFDEFGLVDQSHSEYSYKRKMKTVIFIRYKIPLFLKISKEEFRSKILNKEIMYKDISVPEDYIRFFYERFKSQLNIFLKYYSNFYPINDSKETTQHEIRPLSNYELSKCESGINLIIEDMGLQLPPLIEDSGNYFGIPESTFINTQKTNEFEKLVLNRKNIPILPYQEFFNLARGFFRTNINTLLQNIIVNTMTSFEAILYTLERSDKNFYYFKINRKTTILSFYFNTFRKQEYRKETQKAQRKLKNILRGIFPKSSKFQKLSLILHYLNFGRLIRNEIIHKGILHYNDKKIRIRFLFKIINLKNKKLGRKIGISLNVWWECMMNAYRAFNSHILKLKYQSINWDHPIIYNRTHIATSIQKSKGKTILILPNYDWREIYSHNLNLPKFTVPPERFPIGLITKDDKLINLNIDHTRGKYEVVSQKYTEDNQMFAEWIMFKFDITYDEFNHHFDNKTLNIVVDRETHFYNFRTCLHCDSIIPVHRHIEYRNNECPICKNEFDLAKYEKEVWKDLFLFSLQNEQYKKALKYGKIALNLDNENPKLCNDVGINFLKLEEIDQAIKYFEKAKELDNLIPDPYYNLGCAHSLKKQKEKAIEFLRKAIEINPDFKSKASRDSDFNNIKNTKKFKNLVK